MRYRIAITLLLLLALYSRVQGATLKGQIRANELGGPPVSGVQITAVAGANPTTSLDDGTFSLQFPGKQPGEPVHVVVRKQGHVVVNDTQLRVLLPKDGEIEPLILLLCEESDREKMARRFYRLKSAEAIDKVYQQRLRELEGKNQATTAALTGLRKDRDKAKATAERTAGELARLEPGPTSEIYQQAMSRFLAGSPEEALKSLDETQLRSSVERARQPKRSERELREAIQCYLLEAQLLTTLFRLDEAAKSYQEAMAAAPDSFEAQISFAYVSRALGQVPQASTAYARSLELARRSGSKSDVAKALMNLGYMQSLQHRIDEARRSDEEALKTCRELAQKDPDTYLPDVATTLDNLGVLYRGQNRMDKARESFEDALKTYRELAQKNPDTYLPYVSMALYNLGALQHGQNRVDEARRSYEEALKILRDLAQKDSETYLPQVANTLNNLGVLQRDQNQIDEARRSYEEALRISRDLAQKDPETYLPQVAMTLNNLGILQRAQNQIDEARRSYEEALKIRRDLAQKNPDTYLPYVSTILSNLGVLQRGQNRMDEARRSQEEALKILRDLAQKNPGTYLPDLASTLNNLGVLQRDQSQIDEARRSYEEALKIRRDLAQKNPDTYLPDLADTLNNLGILQRDQNQIDEARRSGEEALGIYEDFAKRNPERYEPRVARVKALLKDLTKKVPDSPHPLKKLLPDPTLAGSPTPTRTAP